MPTIKVDKLAGGPITFNYTISTPTAASAKKIDPKLPTVLFLHPVYVPSPLFHFQFSDPKLRKFNLVAVDMRAHGETKGKVPHDFGQEMAAEDIARFISKMNLPCCHIFALSLGTTIALELTVLHPELVASLFLISPLGLEEPADVAEGRQAIHDAWVEGWRNGTPNQEELAYAVCGALELAFCDRNITIVQALVSYLLPLSMKAWNASHLGEYRKTTLDIFLNRRPLTIEELKKISSNKIPVQLVHGLADVAYPLGYSEEFLQNLQDAGVDSSLEAIQGAPHFACVENHAEVNSIFHDFILRHTDSPVPATTKEIVSPWESMLKKNGWVKEPAVLGDDSDED